MIVAGPGNLQAVLAHIARMRGVRCDAYKESCLRRRLAVRMRATGVATYDEYVTVLERDPAEFDRFLDALTINVSNFYRNPDVWDFVADRCLPELFEGAGGVRIWSAGCASGEEAYTLAMMALDARGRASSRAELRIDATDLDERSLDRARHGRYQRTALRDLPLRLRDAHGAFSDRGYEVAASLRGVVHFARRDVMAESPPAARYDMVVCRNLLIYLDRPSQLTVLQGIAAHLRTGGYLVLGKVESLPEQLLDAFETVAVRERVFRRL